MKTVFQSQFFRDATGALSMMRLLSFTLVAVVLLVWVGANLAAIAQAFVGAGSKPALQVVDFGWSMVSVIGLALGTKVVQSFAENKSPLPPLSDLSDLSKARLAAEAERV